MAAPTSALLGTIITLVLFAAGITLVERQAPVELFAQLVQDRVLLPIAVFAFVILIPVLEEFIFRGLLQSWLRRHLSRQPALLITAVAFALMHFASMQGATNLVIVPAVFVIGYFLGHLYERQGSLYASIGLHVTYNALGVFNELLSG